MSLIEKVTETIELQHPHDSNSNSKVIIGVLTDQPNTIYLEHLLLDKRYIYDKATYNFKEESIEHYGTQKQIQYMNILREAWLEKNTLSIDLYTIIRPFMEEKYQTPDSIKNLFTIGKSESESESEDEDTYFRGNIEEYIRGC